MKIRNKLKTHSQCPKCAAEGKDNSKDNLATYSDGSTYCFACSYSKPSNSCKSLGDFSYLQCLRKDTLSNTIREGLLTQQYIPWRGVSLETMRLYKATTEVQDDGVPLRIRFPYGEDGAKVRYIDHKEFYTDGKMHDGQPLYGMDRFSAGQERYITITEGEMDAMSVYQMLGSRYPAVSVRGASTARGNCEKARDFLNSFDKIYLCFDNDKAGQDAVKEVSKLFDVNKVYHVVLTRFKDANEYLTNGASYEFNNVWNNSKPIRQKGVVADYSEIKAILEKETEQAKATYPFPSLQQMTYGVRTGELVLFTAQEKVGKTEVMRAIEYHLLKETDDNIGVIHLEEGEKRATQGLIGYELNCPVHLPDSGVSTHDQMVGFQSLTKRDGRLHFYAHFGSDDPNTILDIIRYLVTVCHCKYIFLDHITMLVTGFEGEDERLKLDYISTRLAMMTRELDFTLFLVSHVNDEGKTRGSRNISKVADLIVHLDRNVEGATLDERNTTVVTVRGNRYAGRTGPAGYLRFDPVTYKISELEIEDFDGNVA